MIMGSKLSPLMEVMAQVVVALIVVVVEGLC